MKIVRIFGFFIAITFVKLSESRDLKSEFSWKSPLKAELFFLNEFDSTENMEEMDRKLDSQESDYFDVSSFIFTTTCT